MFVVHVIVAPLEVIEPAATAEITGGGSGAPRNSMTSFLGFIKYLFELETATGKQPPVQPVWSVRDCPAGTFVCTVAWPGKLSVPVELREPPLYASTLRRRNCPRMPKLAAV